MQGWIALSIMVGGIQALVLDRWLPVSILAWQRQWPSWQTMLVSTLGFLGHVGAGLLLAYVLVEALHLSRMVVAFVAVVLAVFRIFRDRRGTWASDVLATGAQGKWGLVRVLYWLGPAEFILPLWSKASPAGSLLVRSTALGFCVGTVVVGVTAVTLSQRLWSRPRWIVQTLRVPAWSVSVAPVAVVSAMLLLFFK